MPQTTDLKEEKLLQLAEVETAFHDLSSLLAGCSESAVYSLELADFHLRRLRQLVENGEDIAET